MFLSDAASSSGPRCLKGFDCLCSVPVFKVHDRPIFNVAPFERLSALNILSAMGLGFLLALLIFIDQNIVVSLTNAPENRRVSSAVAPPSDACCGGNAMFRRVEQVGKQLESNE